MTTVYLIRHAQAMGNLEKRSQGSTDAPLSPRGREQLEYLAQRCRDIPAVHIYTSPLSRASDTAKAANRFLNLPLTPVPDLQEIHMGHWEGRLLAEVDREWPEERRMFREELARFVSPGGESMAQVYHRVRTALLDIAAKHPDQTVIAASHGGAIAAALAWAMGGPENMEHRMIPRNTALAQIDIDPDGTPRLIFDNDYAHLPPELV